MDTAKREYIYKLLYKQNKKDTIDDIKDITDSELLHIIAGNYNWDNGFEIPYSIINNKNCDLGTALMIFYDADGYRVLENREELKNPNLKQWAKFISEIEEKILSNQFKLNNIKFIPPLTKIQSFKLKKNNPNINRVFIEESDGNDVEIPSI
ncbi:DUF4274 domain-containing protein [Clostridium sp. D43t1_170807_H7]|uniref:DUF4274 domain-containing protein n=1 Tax=Clostridium sp. D43t1_170807_H7 TaxID=2787140 RepID=UPI00189A33F7|nr:DUF4274 domain-containing protein [Clostridium sp. D43t1_170807_H7]